jgi:alanine racemase
MAPNSQVLFMVKADGYGHGMIPVVRYAYSELGIREFGCATLAEAFQLRVELRDLLFDIYVFSDTQIDVEENIEIYVQNRILPVISNLNDLDFVLHHPDFKNMPLCLKFNSGMNRLGLDPEEVSLVVSRLKKHGRLSLHHLFTHFANSSEPMNQHERNLFQHKNFVDIKKFFREAGIILERTSQSNSGAIEQGHGFEDTHIRPGLMMYGPTSLSSEHHALGHFQGKIVSRLETTILRTFDVEKGDPIGYGSTPCPHEGVIAVLAIGYGDGFSTRYAGAHLTHHGFRGVITGRVNMDMLQVLFPLEARGHIKAREIVTIWGNKDDDLLNFSRETKTIPYEIFCALLPRIPRVLSGKLSKYAKIIDYN